MYASSLDAEAAFYEAFTSADLGAMMSVWAPSGEIVCVHPSGPRVSGIEAVRASWASILSGQVYRTFDLRGLVVTGTESIHIHLLEENISVPCTSFVAPPVLATNIYQHLQDGWRMIVHHASVAPAALDEDFADRPDSASGSRLH